MGLDMGNFIWTRTGWKGSGLSVTKANTFHSFSFCFSVYIIHLFLHFVPFFPTRALNKILLVILNS